MHGMRDEGTQRYERASHERNTEIDVKGFWIMDTQKQSVLG